MTVQEILNKAAHLIEECGWIQGSYGSPSNGYCAVGAMAAADGFVSGGSLSRAFDYSDALVLLEETVGYESVVLWNDAPRRTKEEVIAKLREAANNAEQ